jgi:predicted ATP-grasp superfamily ATP-dependent carboligase
MVKIFITDGRSLATLAIARSLGEKGFEVHCGEEFKHNLTFFSRYVKKRIVYSSPEKQPDQFINEMLKLVKKEKYDMIIPVRDETTLLLSKYKDVIMEYTNLYLASYEIIKKLMDKGETVKIATNCGVPVPKTYFPEEMSIKEIKKYVEYPVLIRPRISSGARGISYVNSPEKLDEAYYKVKKEYDRPMIQEYISHNGGHYSIGALFDEKSKPLAIHIYKEIKQYPISGGPAVNAISVEKEKWVDDMLRILKEVGWKGPAHMDVLYDISSNTPRLLEINPRFWMTLNLSIKSGVDFPYILYMLAISETVEPIESYKVGLKYRWVLPNEILWLMQTPNKIKGFREFINFWEKDTCYGVLSLGDPMPIIGTTLQGFNFLLDVEKRKFMFNRG